MTDVRSQLPEIERRLHRVLLEGMLRTGLVPDGEALITAAGIDAAALPRHLAVLAAADYLSLDADGRVSCLYPFSLTPTPHAVGIGALRRYAMCSIDALGMAAMLGQAVVIDSVCGLCGKPIHVDVAPGALAHAVPLDTVVVARRSGVEPACETCCPSTLFACHPAHGAELAARLSETIVVPLEEALRHAEAIFGDLLSETLPVRRRRSHLAGLPLQT